MLTGIGAWLRKQREARGWARREMAIRLTQAAQAIGDTTVPGIEHLCTYIRRWESSRHDLTERYKIYYCTAFGISLDEWGSALPPPPPKVKAEARSSARSSAKSGAEPDLAASMAAAYRGMYGSDMGRFSVERVILMAAHDGSDRTDQYENGIAGVTFEQLRADIVRLSSLVDTGEPLAAFLEIHRVRDRIYRLLDRRLWPQDQTGLHFLLGCICGLMGVAATNLGYPDAAEELHRTGLASATSIDHRPLMARLRCELSTIAYLRGRFAESRNQALGGLEYLSTGPGGAHLHTNHARAAARLGDVDVAREAVRSSHEARDRDPDYADDLQEIGGEYAISRATHQGKVGAVLADIPSAEREAAEELERAIGFYDEGPGEREVHWFAGKPLASINLAVVRLRSGALDGAAAALEPALSLPVAQRISDVTVRLAAVRDELAAPIYRGSAQARDMGEQVEEFGREAVVAGLHSLPGGPG
ncbi:MAG: helix-turn-helix transcriptional regulator [Streptosporangiaceae bacterium]|nr:helix-turn-helix transcriptional regulator [Streptosporangiaceae bacterium]